MQQRWQFSHLQLPGSGTICRLTGAAPLSPPPRSRPNPQKEHDMVAFAKRVIELYVESAARYPMPMIWTL